MICGSFWKSAATTTIGTLRVDRVEGQQKIAAHVEVESSGRQQELVVGLRAALHDRDVEAVFGVSAVGDRLVISAMLGLGEPVGPERNLVGGERGRREQAKPKRQASAEGISLFAPVSSCRIDACNLGAIEEAGAGAPGAPNRVAGDFRRCAD